jgi:DNA-binding LytR/AlgR family response regulator
MKIAICDDEMFFRQELIKALDKYAFKHGVDFLCFEFPDGKDLLRTNTAFDLIFMDYRMKYIDGIETTGEMRKRSIDTAVIFVSSHKEIAIESLKVRPFRFLVKPVDMIKLHEALDSFLKEYNNEKHLIVIDDINKKKCRINESAILYAEAANVYALIRTFDETFRYSATLSALEKNLQSHFLYRTHRSYIVNFNYIFFKIIDINVYFSRNI